MPTCIGIHRVYWPELLTISTQRTHELTPVEFNFRLSNRFLYEYDV